LVFFAVTSTEPADRSIVNGAELAAGVIVVEDVVCRIVAINTLSPNPFYNVNSIFLPIKDGVNVAHNSPCIV
jgi:hypothetical protein